MALCRLADAEIYATVAENRILALRDEVQALKPGSELVNPRSDLGVGLEDELAGFTSHRTNRSKCRTTKHNFSLAYARL